MLIIKFIPTHLAVISLLALSLTACSTVQGYFPDKERDYQLIREIPPLKVPADIASKGLKKMPTDSRMAENAETVAVMGEIVKAAPVNPDATTATTTLETEQQKPEDIHVELVKFSNGDVRLQVNTSVIMTWRMIGKALSRKLIEITARDQANGEFSVQYDPNERDYKDDSFWDEVLFVFSGDHSNEKPYHIKLVARDKMTEVAVLDEQNKPLAEGEGLSLLKLLLTTLEADLADK